MATPQTPLGLYIHWPFCESKCPYCDFNSHVAGRVDHAAWRDGLLRAMEHMADTTHKRGAILHSIFIGGGTPSLMQPATIAALIEAAGKIFAPCNDMEITMEANPSSVEAERLAGFAGAGVNRISLGMQSLDDNALRFLGRRHSADEALAALEVAQKTFPRVSADFIYALPDDTPAAWEQSLTRILALGLKHLSLYQLTLERGTAFWDAAKRGRLTLPPDDTARNLFDMTRTHCRAAGLSPYETSNFAATGEQCRHNLIYWRGHDWLGIGPGAYGRFTRDGVRFETASRRDPAAWLTAPHTAFTTTSESAEARRDEILMMGLRLEEGVAVARLYDVDAKTITALCHEGLMEWRCGRIRLTDRGAPLINSIAAMLAGQNPAAALATTAPPPGATA